MCRGLKQGKSQASGNGQGYLSHSLSYSPKGPFLGRYTGEAAAGHLAVIICVPQLTSTCLLQRPPEAQVSAIPLKGPRNQYSCER